MSQNNAKPRPGASTITPYGIRTSPYYSSVTHGNGPCTILTTAGQIGARPDGSVPFDPVEQYKQAIANLRRCLEAAGARVQDTMKLTYYIVDYDSKNPRHRPILMEFLGDHRPASTLIPVEKLAAPEFLFEIEATAAIPQEVSERVDVVVIGAGLSGLQAAVDLHKAGLSVKVLEARDRVGGKTWSRSAQGSVCDVGAAWINDTNQSKMFALAQKYGLELITQNTEGSIVCDEGIGNHKTHPYGQLLADESDKAHIEDIIRIRDIFEASCQQIDIRNPVASGQKLRKDLDEITFEQWLQSLNASEHAMNAMKVGTRAMLGVEPSEMSATYFLDYCKSGGGYMQMRSDRKDGGQYLRVYSGTQSFSTSLASELPEGTLLLMSPVRKVEQLDERVRVTSARGVFEASRVVVSIPTPLYQEITFSPPLPVEKVELSKSTKLGDYCKSILFYQTPWWRKYSLTGMSQSAYGPCGVTRDSSVDADKHYSLTCFIVGQPARDWMTLTAGDRRTAVLEHIDKLFSKFATVEQPIHIEEQIWRNEQWSQGCPCPVMGPGGLTKFEKVLRAPVDKLHFVGTETAFEWKGYMEGAVRSGERGAQEVLQCLNSAKL
ncbi:Putative flavin amine oxidase, YjgF/YER057c/UK114 family, RutC-like superfamily [Septoria linicola]|uniref:Amine oxidase n=1 Tax=Septoria linicola TaxID=215465 RepID=A0A9Q9APR9_9PEZI|nr:putative flavin amine oxidase, YjgF/YER057c/UK114 family, RutC-like superfamily [Septoria linicola]USW53209.1 Putative flavin amine oxidase, YjgF/YER057c/UK114 family, RutC-like superfamily [Septoria linicola]